ncbi:pre-mycofactocin synthase MftD [Streptomyces rhizosphaericus]|uniref:Mycofactocin biosynthesis FMN-dependent deaminase MftD n=1 Tax=Streptomyces rhizosphaericus TaxID=114699 RepID=A0A6G4AHW2_9ACTN|nr:pre-mycofactocin synthase MftD [Streptomyces rhizosphaericus]NEW72933.1 mycofactocin biosynthesis FMN-dependent deaminase MftD [Streptomyces rhizosphaericus]
MASTKQWFETVAEAQRRAKKRVPKSVYLALLAGAEEGRTLSENVAAFGKLGFRPRIADLPAQRDQTTTVMGQELSLPVILSPTGVQAVAPDGELAVARAATTSGTALGLSSFASKPIEDVVAANPKTFFQVYWQGDREAIVRRLERAARAGAKGLIVTLDWTFAHRRDWGSPALPDKVNLKSMLTFAPQVIARPRWLTAFLRRGTLPDLTTPNLAEAGQAAPTFFGAYGEWMGTPPPTWRDLAWLRERWDGPFLLKGISHPEDARRAVDIGASAISVSNHGGNNLDSTPASIRLLPGIVDAVGGQVDVVLDGGIRRGGDVVKALALGARAVLVGRPYLWGMAANGETGVHNVLEVLRGGIDSALLGLARSSVRDLVPEDVLVPDGFRIDH